MSSVNLSSSLTSSSSPGGSGVDGEVKGFKICEHKHLVRAQEPDPGSSVSPVPAAEPVSWSLLTTRLLSGCGSQCHHQAECHTVAVSRYGWWLEVVKPDTEGVSPFFFKATKQRQSHKLWRDGESLDSTEFQKPK